jgi:hypothetical protein
VVVIDNGSSEPLERAAVEAFGPGFRYFYRESAWPSPAGAINFAVAQARHDMLCVYIDGARIASPGLLRDGLRGLALAPRAVVATMNWHLGPDVQWRAAEHGYDRGAEDRMLAAAGWIEDGYQLFGHAVLGGSSRDGFFRIPAESNALFLSRALFQELGGYDERFRTPGGGLANPDFFKRACEAPETELVMLLGEGTFHQMHGGASTNAADEHGRRVEQYRAEYASIRGRAFERPTKALTYLGALPPQAVPFLVHSARRLAARAVRPW